MKNFLKGLIFEEDSAAAPKADKPLKPQMAEKPAAPPVMQYAQPAYPQGNSNGYQPGVYQSPTVDQNIKSELLGLIKEHNFPGFDYCEFLTQMEVFKTVPLPDAQKYQTAFFSLKAQADTAKQPFDKTILVDTAQKYKQIIQQELNDFEGSFAEMYKEKVENKKSAIQGKAEQIAKLNEQIQQLSAEINQMNVEVVQEDNKLQMNKSNFVAAANSVISDIEKEITNINTYIQ